MYTSSSLSPLSLLLSEVTVSDSSLSLPGKYSSSDSIPSCSVYFATSADNQCERDACGGSLVMVVVRLYIQDSASSVLFVLQVLISSLGNCFPLNHKGISSPSMFLVHPELQWSIYVSQGSVQCLYW